MCDLCPFKGCRGCRFTGGETVAAQANTGEIGYTGNAHKATPSGASTPNAGGLAPPNAPEGLPA